MNYKRKIISTILAFALGVSLVCFPQAPVYADSDPAPLLTANIAYNSAIGAYEIYNADQLKEFAEHVNAGNYCDGVVIKLTEDIDLEGSDTNRWTPIGDEYLWNFFSGTFDGQNHTVSGLYVKIDSSSTEEVVAGLFGQVVEGTVKNLQVGGTVSVNVNNNTGTKFIYAGGVVGECWEGSITNCRYIGDVKINAELGNTTERRIYAGGIVGETMYLDEISGCMNSGDVEAKLQGTEGVNSTAEVNAGGIVGQCHIGDDDAYEGLFWDCRSDGNVKAIAIDEGTGVSNGAYAGGVIGYLLVPGVSDGEVKNCCHLIGAVSAGRGTENTTVYKGGVIGKKSNDGNIDIENYYYNCEADGAPTLSIGDDTEDASGRLTSEQCTQQSSFDGLNFDSVWYMAADGPQLRAFVPQETPEIKPTPHKKKRRNSTVETPTPTVTEPAEETAEPTEVPDEPAVSGSEPATDTTPEGPLRVLPSPQNLMVNGNAYKPAAYNINGTNYVKLRDLAFMLSGTSAQFGVTYDATANRIVIAKGQLYAGEIGKDFTDMSKSARLSSQSVMIDGAEIKLKAYNIGGFNYFNLRGLASLIGYEISYDKATNTAGLTTK